MKDLTTERKTKLRQLEGIIERGLSTYYAVGNAAAQIRDEKLYRDDFDTFEQYCKARPVY